MPLLWALRCQSPVLRIHLVKRKGRKVSSQWLGAVPPGRASSPQHPSTEVSGQARVARFLRRESIRTQTGNPDCLSFTFRGWTPECPLAIGGKPPTSTPTFWHKAPSDLPTTHSAHSPACPGSSQEAVRRAPGQQSQA